MADVANQALLRFIAVRDPQRVEPSETVPRVRAGSPWEPTSFHQSLREAPATGRSVVELANDFVRSEQFVASLYDAPAVIGTLDAILVRRGDDVPGAEVVDGVERQWVKRHKGEERRDVSAILGDEAFLVDRLRCADSLLAATFGDADPPSARPDLMRVMALYGLLDVLAERPDLTAEEVGAVVANALVLVPSDIPVGEAAVPAAADEELRAGMPDGAAAALARAQRLDRAADAVAADVIAAGALPDAIADAAPWVLTEVRRARLPQDVQETLMAAGVTDGASMPAIVESLRGEAAAAYAEAALGRVAGRQADAIRAELTRLRPGWLETSRPDIPVVSGPFPVLVRPPRIGDLDIVRQELVCYERGEIAHVENLLPGESKLRDLRVVDLQELETTTTNEREEERSWDNQTTDRNELSSEVSTVVSEDSTLEAGLNVSARYGPYVEVNANVGYTKSNATTTSTRNAASYAREVTQRAAGRVSTRVTETRRALTRRETTERNRHKLSNDGSENLVGYYRWLNKRYRAQVVNYGRRLLLELVVPDPAVNVRYAAARAGGLEVDVDAPPPLRLPGGMDPLRPDHITPMTWQALAALFRVPTLTPPPPEFITAALSLQSDVPSGAQGQQPAGNGAGSGTQPAQPDRPTRHYKASDRLSVPEGYQPLRFIVLSMTDGMDVAERVRAQLRAAIDTLPVQVQLVRPLIEQYIDDAIGQARTAGSAFGYVGVGPAFVPVAPGLGRQASWFGWGGSGIAGLPDVAPSQSGGGDLPITLLLTDSYGYAITVTVLCARAGAVLARWQAESYAAILERHTAWEGEFRSAVRAARSYSGVLIDGRNPLEADYVIRGELKRQVVGLLGGPQGAALQAVDPGDPESGKQPYLSPAATARVGPEVAFFEQAFEWPQMSWLMYPYFWTGRDDWPEQFGENDPDPVFAQFLRAGAARVVLPVRPGFQRAVCSRLALPLRKEWLTDPAPIPGEEPWLSLVEEIQGEQRIGVNGTPVGESWPVVLPTTLVALDDAEELFDCPRLEMPAQN